MRTLKSKRYGMAKIKTTVALVFLFLNTFLCTQVDKIRFRHLSVVLDGLSQEVVKCIRQDKKRFMWFGTQDGLNRYDGYNFKIYKNDFKDKTTISDHHILCIYEDQGDDLWIGTKNGGLNRYNRQSDNFIHYKDYPTASKILGVYDVQTI